LLISGNSVNFAKGKEKIIDTSVYATSSIRAARSTSSSGAARPTSSTGAAMCQHHRELELNPEGAPIAPAVPPL
jgi:hypothetical protein